MQSKSDTPNPTNLTLLSAEFRKDAYHIFLEYLSSGGITAMVSKEGQTTAVAAHDIQGLPKGDNLSLQQMKAYFEQADLKVRTFDNNQMGLSFGFAIKGGGNVINSQDRLWPNGVVPYVIDRKDFKPNSKEYAQVVAAIKYWNVNTDIQLRPKNRSDVDYLNITEHNDSCSSHVGRMGGQQFIRCDIDTGRFSIGSLIHEIGHAVGLSHEQKRTDRYKFVKIHWENIKQGKHNNFKISRSTQPYGGYDYHSIMHYSRFAFSSNRKATITPRYPLPPNTLGQRNMLSKGDIAAVNYLVEQSKVALVSPVRRVIRLGDEMFFRTHTVPVARNHHAEADEGCQIDCVIF